MKPRWLLLAVGVVCLLVLAPAAALSQEGTEIACGSAVIDGTVGTAEWADATRLPMSGYYEVDDNFEGIPQAHGAGLTGELQPSNGEQTHGWLYLKNDERYLYVGATMDIGVEHPEWWGTYLEVAFTDEPCGVPGAWVDDEWEKDLCTDSPGEGWFWAADGQSGGTPQPYGPRFAPGSEDEGYCEGDEVEAQGVIAKAGLHTAHYEMRIDLEGSELNCAGAGDCFRFYAYQEEWFCPPGEAQCAHRTEGWVEWPAFDYDPVWEAPDAFGTICLNPCEVEFVPEPGTVLLLGSGLLSLAGYAGLRRRERS